ncbi:unnamed protein product [Zymoseptoria tritici ST99CH_1A5]|uniref:Uncharacterized protein n=1 Tax=Zymoseptoria tritici ST99CH_1A5 TaxID=1276529 RepID=A0A1Y6M383_ZYMTR|nr:unnamed protein product [Zymoseptoria tritici ST99CH_1A5]
MALLHPPTSPASLLWAHQLKREHGYLLERMQKLEAEIARVDSRNKAIEKNASKDDLAAAERTDSHNAQTPKSFQQGLDFRASQMPPQDQSTVNDTCFSAFSEVPDMTVFAKIGQSATKTLRTPGHESSRKRPSLSRSPSPTPRRMKTPGHGSQMNNNGTTSFLIDFTQQMEGVNTYRQHSPVDGAFLANEGAGHDFAIRGAAADGHSIRTASLAVEPASLVAEQENFAIKGAAVQLSKASSPVMSAELYLPKLRTNVSPQDIQQLYSRLRHTTCHKLQLLPHHIQCLEYDLHRQHSRSVQASQRPTTNSTISEA